MSEPRDRARALLAAGVRVLDPASTFVGEDVVVEPGAVLRPFSMLEGHTTVRAGAEVGPFVRLVNVEVGPGALILDHCLLRDSVVEAGASVGPFRYVAIYNDSATSPADALICWFDYGSAITLLDGESFTIDFDVTNGLFQLS